MILAPTGRSRKGAWIEIFFVNVSLFFASCRSRKGAWIEIACATLTGVGFVVAPVRERGLKYELLLQHLTAHRRSRKGAWIEISSALTALMSFSSLP